MEREMKTLGLVVMTRVALGAMSCAMAIVLAPAAALAQQSPAAGSYSVIKTVKAGGDGGFDYVYADVAGRRLYIPRRSTPAAVTVFDLDTLEPVGSVANVNGHGATVDSKSAHGFATSKPVAMWNTKSLALIKTIDVDGNPDGLLEDPYNERVYIFSHVAPNVTVIDATNGNVLGTIDLGGQPEQAVSDGKGHLYIDIADKANIAVVDANTLRVTAHYDMTGIGGNCGGLALDIKNHILFSACHNQNFVVLNADDGKIITTFPIGAGNDGAVFNPATMEAFASQTDGTLAIVKENSPTSFIMEQSVQTKPGAKTLTLDTKTNHVLLITADYITPAAPSPAAAPPAPIAGAAQTGPRVVRQMVPDSFSILVVGK
jgi:YVTN family beta-propeller protein